MLERALELTPGYTPALQLLAKLYRESADFEALLKLQLPAVDPIRDPAILALKSGRVCFEEIGDIERGIAFPVGAGSCDLIKIIERKVVELLLAHCWLLLLMSNYSSSKLRRQRDNSITPEIFVHHSPENMRAIDFSGTVE